MSIGETPPLNNVDIKLPPLKGGNLIDHFYTIATEQTQPYRELLNDLCDNGIPKVPKRWKMTEGWTRYSNDGTSISVPYPEDDALIFDIEVCVREGNAPTMACAVSKTNWYSWTSKMIVSNKKTKRKSRTLSETARAYSLNEMIPMEDQLNENSKPKMIIGHNVSYDRARISNQYQLQPTLMRFLDTMSLHTCVSGITSFQRAMLKSSKEIVDTEDLAWTSLSSLNSLVEVFKLYCGSEKNETIDKQARSVFVDGTLDDIRYDFQNLMSYCASDVVATYRVFQKLYPMFCERFPHPTTLAGMLELGMAYLPVNSNWFRYINESDLIYKDFDIESKYLLAKRANQACRLIHNEAHQDDLWLWDEDWSVQQIKFKKSSTNKKKQKSTEATKSVNDNLDEYQMLEKKFQYLFDTKEHLPKRVSWLVGYPAWYRSLCTKHTEDDWQPGPSNIGTGMRIAPKLLSLCWEGYPLHFIREHGWGFLVPFSDEIQYDDINKKIPMKKLLQKCPIPKSDSTRDSNGGSDFAMEKLSKDVEMDLGRRDYYSKPKSQPTEGNYKGSGVWCNVELENCCWFMKLPHKDGANQRVGNPLARDFLIKFSENVLTGDHKMAERVIQIARMLSYWRNNRDRILNQMVVVDDNSNNNDLISELNLSSKAAIIPLVVTCGTLTRRAMEPTWMTASNAKMERIGSELRSMVQAPEGYRFVGADVDSQELWIASVLGDANEVGIHGATPFGWMTLNGTKSNGTDMHSLTAKAVGVSRDHAKVLNYARIYGAGHIFATRLLKQFNPTISDGEAKSKAMKMFAFTKGKKYFYLKDEFLDEFERQGFSKYEAQKIAAKYGKQIDDVFLKGKWYGGTESAMFNRLEEIADMSQPRTPFLECRLSRAIEPNEQTKDRFLPTRINWVVQSGAVDFLHLMLVCMRWLMGNKIRFCLSFHDEIRYLVEEKYAYQAAVGMHLTNLLTRSFCSTKIGINDLPQSVAFFTTVEIDKVLRKEADLDCKTPSNPHGLSGGYGIPFGESLNIHAAIEKAGGSDVNQWNWHKEKLKKIIIP